MNKASKHIQSGAMGLTGGNSSAAAILLGSPTAAVGGNQPVTANATSPKNVINSIMDFLPDNRPITSLQIVEDFERCPKNFNAIHRTYDQDADADLWRDYTLLFGRQTTRYLCLSKSEGLPEYVVETLKVVAEKIQPPKEFSLLSRTADTEQKAWRKRQIAYKLSKRGTVTHAVTDIIVCSKLKTAPNGFKLAGDINGVLICYKTGAIPVRQPPPVPLWAPLPSQKTVCEAEQALNRLNLHGQRASRGPLPQPPTSEHHDYEEIQANYQINSPQRPAPPRPSTIGRGGYGVGTLGTYTELEGVPFAINGMLQRNQQVTELPTLPELSTLLKTLDYDFQLERQILCTMKSSASKNPFFK
ncbi:multivesicular body subunit 12A [Scaptodrosophila lebanonensis]|uniref:Multivesicular body subunit 12A n=1 Tax=Drosophila lebanonensis TaxID=7225 RepID=A0A6J2TPI0_DROLE|nr:multivesicular body subunit 12A [Scaptodrosophila lebanonensis]XP_030377953.1 multivesicular body subunit 12A [Scaptodrosophila lebanonensis]XP_030377954.1 multivesicular body subunit 12A [Scaptodrosophila lebanonensis]XP_030377955.1 multivesicular body subunit 12A [Scaptodrosophila lebanonensis]